VLISFLVMGVMLLPWALVWLNESESRNERRKALRPMSASEEDPEEKRLWRLAERKANAEIAEWERKTGKNKTPAGRREMTRKIYEEIKAEKGGQKK